MKIHGLGRLRVTRIGEAVVFGPAPLPLATAGIVACIKIQGGTAEPEFHGFGDFLFFVIEFDASHYVFAPGDLGDFLKLT